jgi:hypothetical protein
VRIIRSHREVGTGRDPLIGASVALELPYGNIETDKSILPGQCELLGIAGHLCFDPGKRGQPDKD